MYFQILKIHNILHYNRKSLFYQGLIILRLNSYKMEREYFTQVVLDIKYFDSVVSHNEYWFEDRGIVKIISTGYINIHKDLK